MEENPSMEMPSPPIKKRSIDEGPAQMSEVASLGNIFVEPGRVFEDMRRKPRFIIGAIVISLLVTAYGFGLYQKVGEPAFREFYGQQMEKQNPSVAAMPVDQRNQAIDLYMMIGTVTRFAMPLMVFIFILIGGMIYWLAGKAFGSDGSLMQAISTWTYASLPPTVVSMIASFIILVFKNTDNIDIAASQQGVVNANLALLVDSKLHPYLGALLGMFDFFLIWGWILGVIGLQKTMRISSGSAWTLTIILALVMLGFKLLGAAFS